MAVACETVTVVVVHGCFRGRVWLPLGCLCLKHSSVSFVTEEAATVVASRIANRSQEKHEFVAYYKTQFRSFLGWDPLQFSVAYCVTKHCSADYQSKRRCNRNAKRALKLEKTETLQ